MQVQEGDFVYLVKRNVYSNRHNFEYEASIFKCGRKYFYCLNQFNQEVRFLKTQNPNNYWLSPDDEYIRCYESKETYKKMSSKKNVITDIHRFFAQQKNIESLSDEDLKAIAKIMSRNSEP